MSYLFFLAILLAMLLPQNQRLPDSFDKIPTSISETATIIVSGTYSQGRTPCMLRPDGTRVWALDSRFIIKRVYRGKVGSTFIRINAAMLPKSDYVSKSLKSGQKYLVLLRPSEANREKIKTVEGVNFWEALRDEEIIAIVESK